MRIFNKNTLIDYGKTYPDASVPLMVWHNIVVCATWQTPQDIKNIFASASFLANDRVVFNIKGNTYRLITSVDYEYSAVYIKFFGTHAGYDKIDASTI